METYRRGHNGADSKSVCGQPHVGSNPSCSANKKVSFVYRQKRLFWVMRSLRNVMRTSCVMSTFGLRCTPAARVWNASHHLSQRSCITYHLKNPSSPIKSAEAVQVSALISMKPNMHKARKISFQNLKLPWKKQVKQAIGLNFCTEQNILMSKPSKAFHPNALP